MTKYILTIIFVMGIVDAFASRSELSQQILKQYGEALDESQRQKTAGLIRSAAAKSKAEQAHKALVVMQARLAIIEDKLNQSSQSIQRMENEFGKVDLS